MSRQSMHLAIAGMMLGLSGGLYSMDAWALSAGDASESWDHVDQRGKAGFDDATGINIVFPDRQTCFDRSGNAVSESSGPPRRKGKNAEMSNCDAVVDFLDHEENRNDTLNGKHGQYGSSCGQSQECVEKNLKALKEERDSIPAFLTAVIPNRVTERKKALDAAIASLASRESTLQNKQSEAPKLQAKQKSRECRLFRLTDGLCTQTVMVANANERLKAEDQVTAESGIINKRERYSAGQQKAVFGQNMKTNLAEYQKVAGKPFDKKVCKQESEPDKDAEIKAEIKACGCSDENNGVDDSPAPCQ